jgi:uncharacterized protein (DUF342 family)
MGDGEARQGAGLTFRLDPEAKALIATATPDAAALPIDEGWLRARLAELGHGALRYLPLAATRLLAGYNSGEAVEVKLAESVDAAFNIVVAPDGLEARLRIQPAQGGAPVARPAVLAALADMGIGRGILDAAIDAAIAAGAAADAVIARGLPPDHGRDGWFESLVPEVRSRAPRVDETGHTDYRDLGEILVVHPGDALLRRHGPTPGRDGATLLGETIPAKPGKEVMFAASLPGTAPDAADPDLLRAAITGQPVVVRGGMIVEPVFKIETVGTASGNIDFDGSVVIKGDVAAGMTVRATGDIEVGGVVERGTLEAGGSIVIKGGAIGDLGHKGGAGGESHIRCGGCFNAAYAQQATVEAGDGIFIDDMAMQCALTAINHVRVGNNKRGHIIGGTVHATLSITAKVIGSPNRVRTHLEIGVNPLMHKQLLAKATERDGKETQLLEVSKLLAFAQAHAGKLPPPMIEKARATAAALSADIAALREEQDAMTKKIDLSMQACVRVEQALYEGVEVLMGNQRYRVVGEHGPCAVGIGIGGLGLLPLEEVSPPDAEEERPAAG